MAKACGKGELKMITAAQAREKTLERITQIAKEFITNCAEPAIDEAVAEGKFKATPSFEGVVSPEATGAAVVELLKEQGFEAEHVCYDNVNGYANYIRIKWEED
jgi:hypothetical protein